MTGGLYDLAIAGPASLGLLKGPMALIDLGGITYTGYYLQKLLNTGRAYFTSPEGIAALKAVIQSGTQIPLQNGWVAVTFQYKNTVWSVIYNPVTMEVLHVGKGLPR